MGVACVNMGITSTSLPSTILCWSCDLMGRTWSCDLMGGTWSCDLMGRTWSCDLSGRVCITTNTFIT